MLYIDHAASGEAYSVWKADDDDGYVGLLLNKDDLSFKCGWYDTKLAEFEVGENEDIELEKKKYHYFEYAATSESFDDTIIHLRFSGKSARFGKVKVFVEEFYPNKDMYEKMEKIEGISIGDVDYDVYLADSDDASFSHSIYVVRPENKESLYFENKIDIKYICEALSIDSISDTKLCVRGSGQHNEVNIKKNKIVSRDYEDDMMVPDNSRTQENVFYNGLTYTLWQSDDIAKSEMTVKGNGNAVASFKNTSDNSSYTFFKKGKLCYDTLPIDKYNKINIKYSDYIDASCNYRVGAYGWFTDPNVEFFIIQFKDPENVMFNSEPIKTVEIDGVKYDIYKYNLAAFDAPPMIQYWSVSQVAIDDKGYDAVGEIDLLKHFKEWEKAGLKLGNLYEVSSYAEAYGKGEADFILKDCDIDIEADPHAESEDIIIDPLIKIWPTFLSAEEYYYTNNGKVVIKPNGKVIGEFSADTIWEYYAFFGKAKRIDDTDFNKIDKSNVIYDVDISPDNGTYDVGATVYFREDSSERYSTLRILDVKNKDIDTKGLTAIGETVIEGRIFDLYAAKMDPGDPYTFEGYVEDPIYYSICRENKKSGNVKGNIDVIAHLKALNDAGYKTSYISNISLVVSMFDHEKGYSVINKAEIEFTTAESTVVPDSDTVKFTEDDIKLFKSFLLGKECDLSGKNFDLNGDGVWDSFDLIAMKKAVNN